MLISTMEHVPGTTIVQHLGLVTGNTIRAKDFARDFGAGLKNLVGGELKSYTKMMTEARDEATSRMMEQATALGADAVVGVRYTTSMVIGGAAEILAYGTAVKLVPQH